MGPSPAKPFQLGLATNPLTRPFPQVPALSLNEQVWRTDA